MILEVVHLPILLSISFSRSLNNIDSKLSNFNNIVLVHDTGLVRETATFTFPEIGTIQSG